MANINVWTISLDEKQCPIVPNEWNGKIWLPELRKTSITIPKATTKDQMVSNPIAKSQGRQHQIKLTPIETDVYDFIKGNEHPIGKAIQATLPKEEQLRLLYAQKFCILWFRQNNLKAYMVLLD